MAAELEGAFPDEDLTIDQIPGSGGVFDVDVDGRLVFSKASSNRFPEPGEIARLLKSD